jgi:TnpA family transposase
LPVDFLTAEQQNRYGRFAGEPGSEQLARYFHLDEADLPFVRGSLGCAVQLGTVRFLGTLLSDPGDVPAMVVRYIARQLAIDEPLPLLDDYRRSQMRWVHAREIRDRFGYRDFDASESFRLARWLYSRAWGSAARPTVLFDLATARLVENKVLLPGVSRLARLVSRVRDRVTARLWQRLSAIPTQEQRARLEGLLVVAEGERSTELDRLRRSPTVISSPSLATALHRLRKIRELGVGHHDISRIHPGRLAALSRFAISARAQAIERMQDDRRIATLLAFAQAIEVRACDDVLDMLDALVKQYRTKAEKENERGRIQTLPSFDAAALKLAGACRRLAKGEAPEAIFALFPADELLVAANVVEATAQPAEEDHVCAHMLEHHRSIQRFLPLLLDTMVFEAADAAKPVVAAWNGLRDLQGRGPVVGEGDVALAVVPSTWRRFVTPAESVVDRRAYTVCVLDRLSHGLQRRDVYVARSKHWGDTRAQLLQGDEWTGARSKVCRMLNLPATVEPYLQLLRDELDEAYRHAIRNLKDSDTTRIESVAEKERIVISPLDALDEPESLLALRARVEALLPHIDLPDVLLEIATWTGFTDEFTHISEGNARVENIGTSVCAVLLAEACNVGLEPVVRHATAALTRGRLSWVAQNYIRAETIRRANARLVNYQRTTPLAQYWGGGEVATADGMRFVVPVRTINAGPNPKYFGTGRGVTYFNFASDQFTGFHSIVVPGTIRDSLFILSGLLEHETNLRPTEVMTDTGSYSDLVFGLFRLLGYQFSPRIAGLGDSRFWRIDRDADYGPLDGIARNRLNLELVADNWNDMLRVAGSLMLGRVAAPDLVRVLQAGGRPTVLGRAIAELGRASKSVHLLTYSGDEGYRRRILLHLNRHEGRHSLSREVFHGQRGALRQRYREGQEDQLGALGLVVNAIVLWNTRYIDATLRHLRENGVDASPDDVARLSPLGYEHINLIGRYHFGLPDAVKRGALRPFRNPEDVDL